MLARVRESADDMRLQDEGRLLHDDYGRFVLVQRLLVASGARSCQAHDLTKLHDEGIALHALLLELVRGVVVLALPWLGLFRQSILVLS